MREITRTEKKKKLPRKKSARKNLKNDVTVSYALGGWVWIAAGQGGRRRGGRRTRCGANDAAWDGGSNEGRKCTDRLIRSRGAGALRRTIRQRVESEWRVWERERECGERMRA